jgi:hypothetical protein
VFGLRLLQRLFPFEASEKDLERFPELEKRFKPYLAVELLPFFAFAGLCGYGWFLLLLAEQARHLARLGPSLFLIAPSAYAWGILALFLGMVSSAPLLRASSRLFLGARAHGDYVLYRNLRAGFDTWKVTWGLALLVAPAALALSYLGLDTYLRVTESEVAVNAFWSLGERRHPFSAVVAVKSASHFRAPSGGVVARQHYIVEFSDGTRWSTRDHLREVDPAEDAKLAAYFAARSGKEVQEVGLAE